MTQKNVNLLNNKIAKELSISNNLFQLLLFKPIQKKTESIDIKSIKCQKKNIKMFIFSYYLTSNMKRLEIKTLYKVKTHFKYKIKILLLNQN